MDQHYPDSVIVSALRREEDQIQSDEKRFTLLVSILFAIIVILIALVLYLFLTTRTNTGPTAAQTEVPAAIASPAATLTTVNTPTPTAAQLGVPLGSVSQTPVNATPTIREYFIPFGTGTNQSGDWEDVPGAQVTVDFGGYRTIQKIVFEVNVTIPTANETASVRIFNVTDKHPVWNSELTTTNNTYTVSDPLIYDTGSKTYQVQMKTQLQFPAQLTQARIHIFLK